MCHTIEVKFFRIKAFSLKCLPKCLAPRNTPETLVCSILGFCLFCFSGWGCYSPFRNSYQPQSCQAHGTVNVLCRSLLSSSGYPWFSSSKSQSSTCCIWCHRPWCTSPASSPWGGPLLNGLWKTSPRHQHCSDISSMPTESQQSLNPSIFQQEFLENYWEIKYHQFKILVHLEDLPLFPEFQKRLKTPLGTR